MTFTEYCLKEGLNEPQITVLANAMLLKEAGIANQKQRQQAELLETLESEYLALADKGEIDQVNFA